MLKIYLFLSLVIVFGSSVELTYGQELHIHNISFAVSHTSTILTCPLTVPGQLDQQVLWEFVSFEPPNPHSMVRKDVKNDTRFLLESDGKSLMIRNVTTDDAGIWKCCYNVKCSTINLVVLDFEKIRSFIPGSINYYGQIITGIQKEFFITVHHNKRLNVEVTNAEYTNERKVCNEIKRVCSTAYGMKNAKLENSEQIEVQISSERLIEKYLLNIVTNGQAVISMESVWSAEQISIKCHGVAYPPPSFGFLFIPADTRHASTEEYIWYESITTSNLSTYVSATGVIKLPLPEAGTV